MSVSARYGSLAGIGFMLLGIFLFSANDALGKWILATFSVGQMLLIRGIAALLVLSPFIYREGWMSFASAPRPGLQLLRLFLSTCEVVMFFWAVSYLPLADTVTYYLAGPIYVTALSALFLGEKVGWRRWTAVIVGFIGVLIALKPSAATFSLPALIALLGSIAYAFLMVVTRYLRGTPDVVMATGQIVTTLAFGAATASFGWISPSFIDVVLMAWLGVIATMALMCINRSLKLAPASVVVPYQYTLIVWAAIFGYFVFGDRIQTHTLIGAAIIVASGLYIFWREQRIGAGKQAVVNPP